MRAWKGGGEEETGRAGCHRRAAAHDRQRLFQDIDSGLGGGGRPAGLIQLGVEGVEGLREREEREVWDGEGGGGGQREIGGSSHLSVFFRTGPHAPSRTWCFPPFIVAGDDLASWAGAAA